MGYDAPAQALNAQVQRLAQELATLRKEFEEYKSQHSMAHMSLANGFAFGHGGNQ